MAVRLLSEQPSGASTEPSRLPRGEYLIGTSLTDLSLLLSALLVLHISVNGTVPSGGDGGNWLALAREMLGEPVMSADVAYEPVFIGLLAALIAVLGPWTALVVGAFLAEAILVGAVYLMVRPVGRPHAIVSTAVVISLGYRLEAVAWGAYPQMFGLGLGLLTLWALASYVNGRNRNWLFVSLIGCLVTLLTHKLVGALLMAATPAAASLIFWQSRWDKKVLKRASIGVGAVVLIGAGFAWSWWAGTSAGVEPSLNPLGLTLAEQVERAFREVGVPWVLVGVLVATGIGIRSWNRTEGLVVAAGFGWLIASVAAFLVTGEPRALIQAQVATIPVAVIVAWRLYALLKKRPRWRGFSPTVAFVVLAALFGSLALTGISHYERHAAWYRVVGQAQITALDGLAAIADQGDLVVASRGPNGNPIGWWVEGYAGLPTYTSIDVGYLAFPDERSQALSAAAVFEDPPDRAAGLLDQIGARFLILDRRGPDAGWLSAGEPASLDIVSDGTLLILEVPDGS